MSLFNYFIKLTEDYPTRKRLSNGFGIYRNVCGFSEDENYTYDINEKFIDVSCYGVVYKYDDSDHFVAYNISYSDQCGILIIFTVVLDGKVEYSFKMQHFIQYPDEFNIDHKWMDVTYREYIKKLLIHAEKYESNEKKKNLYKLSFNLINITTKEKSDEAEKFIRCNNY